MMLFRKNLEGSSSSQKWWHHTAHCIQNFLDKKKKNRKLKLVKKLCSNKGGIKNHLKNLMKRFCYHLKGWLKAKNSKFNKVCWLLRRLQSSQKEGIIKYHQSPSMAPNQTITKPTTNPLRPFSFEITPKTYRPRIRVICNQKKVRGQEI